MGALDQFIAFQISFFWLRSAGVYMGYGMRRILNWVCEFIVEIEIGTEKRVHLAELIFVQLILGDRRRPACFLYAHMYNDAHPWRRFFPPLFPWIFVRNRNSRQFRSVCTDYFPKPFPEKSYVADEIRRIDVVICYHWRHWSWSGNKLVLSVSYSFGHP